MSMIVFDLGNGGPIKLNSESSEPAREGILG